MALENRSIPRQIIYLMLALIGCWLFSPTSRKP